MAIRISCPGCKKAINAPDSFAGKTARCPACKHPIAIPAPPAADDDDDEYQLADDPPTPAAAPRVDSASMQSASAPRPGASQPSWQQTISAGESQLSSPAARQAMRKALVPTTHSRRYWFFALAIVPLALMLLPDDKDLDARFDITLAKNPDIIERLNSLKIEATGKESVIKAIVALTPDKKLDGAHLAVDSYAHWGYALISAGVFAACFWALFPRGRVKPEHALAVAVGTATFGVLFLLALQGMANASDRVHVHGGGIIGLILLLLQFISFSYHAALSSENGFLLSFFGFTFGVGLCEEFCKTFPLLFRFAFNSPLEWRGACFWGLVSGAGFGVAEGIMYSSHYYNGISTPGIYLVRFTACVALHAIWSGAAGISIWRDREFFASEWEWGPMLGHLLLVLGVPMTLHGLYDTLLKKEMISLAVLVAAASFAWLVFLIETTQAIAPDEVANRRAAI